MVLGEAVLLRGHSVTFLERPSWFSGAECRGSNPSLFFAGPNAEQATVARAKEICAVCPVRAECLEYALTHREEYGVWGGLAPRERDVMRRERLRTGVPS